MFVAQVSVSTLTSGSRGLHAPLSSIAAATYTPFGMLFLSQSPVEDIPIPDMWTIRDAGVREPSADLLETIYLCQRRQIGTVRTPSTPGGDPALRRGCGRRAGDEREERWCNQGAAEVLVPREQDQRDVPCRRQRPH